MHLERWPGSVALAVTIALTATTALAEEEPSPPAPGPLTTRVVELEHLDTREAVTAARALFQVRQVIELRERSILVLRDEAPTVDAAAELLARLDVPLPQWVAELVVGSGRDERVLRTLPLGPNGHARARYGVDEHGGVGVSLQGEPTGEGSLSVVYELNARAHRFGVSADGSASVAPGERLELLDTVPAEAAERLGGILGVGEPVDRIALRFRPAE